MPLRMAHQYFDHQPWLEGINLNALTKTHLHPCPSLMKPARTGARKLLPARKNA